MCNIENLPQYLFNRIGLEQIHDHESETYIMQTLCTDVHSVFLTRRNRILWCKKDIKTQANINDSGTTST